MGFPGGAKVVKNQTLLTIGNTAWSLSWGDPLEEDTVTHSSINPWESYDRGAWQAYSP